MQGRVRAWKTYLECIHTVVAKDAGCALTGCSGPDESVKFGYCRHTYFRKWGAFQTDSSLAGTACRTADQARSVDDGDGTVTDNLSGLP